MSDEAKTKGAEDSATPHSPLETLTSLVLDAADAANDSAQSTQEAIKRLTQVVETNEATTRAVRNAPAIFGAIMMSVGIVMAVVVAMVFSKLNERATALDEAMAEESGEAGRRDPTQADILVELAQRAELFHSADAIGFADIDVNGHRETWPIRSKGFKRWLARLFFEETEGAPSSEGLQSALNVI